jgi:hypothetical protein
MSQVMIDVVNESSEASDRMIKWLTAALQIQVTRDFAPIWGINATLNFIPNHGIPNPAHWQLVFLDNADVAGALGYHDLTASGLPLGKVFIRTTELANDAWSVTASHELLEMLVDPYVDNAVIILNADSSGTAYGYEVGDPCEADNLGYVINDFKMSDFATPDWFNPPTLIPGGKFDFTGHMTAPLQILPGGYAGVLNIGSSGGWTQIFQDGSTSTKVPKGSRRELRTKPHSTRVCSKY